MSGCRFINHPALQSPSASAGVWLCLQECLHVSKLVFGPHAQLLPLQSIKLQERLAIQFWDQTHSKDSRTKVPCTTSLCLYNMERPQDCRHLPKGSSPPFLHTVTTIPHLSLPLRGIQKNRWHGELYSSSCSMRTSFWEPGRNRSTEIHSQWKCSKTTKLSKAKRLDFLPCLKSRTHMSLC